MATTEDQMAEEAQKILDGVDQTENLPGLDADTKVTVLGAQFATSQDIVLGQRVELRVVGYVNFVGDQLLEDEGKKHIVKVQTNLIEIIPD